MAIFFSYGYTRANTTKENFMRFYTMIACCMMAGPGIYADDAAANDLLEAMQFDESYDLMFDAFREGVAPEMVPVYQAYQELFRKYMSREMLQAYMVEIYGQAFTTEELQQLAAFYRSPLGQKAHALMPQLGAKVSQLIDKVVLSHLKDSQTQE